MPAKEVGFEIGYSVDDPSVLLHDVGIQVGVIVTGNQEVIDSCETLVESRQEMVNSFNEKLGDMEPLEPGGPNWYFDPDYYIHLDPIRVIRPEALNNTPHVSVSAKARVEDVMAAVDQAKKQKIPLILDGTIKECENVMMALFVT